jgi:2-dehydropantoate 2-reductase
MSDGFDRVLVVGLGALGAPYAHAMRAAKPDITISALVPETGAHTYESEPVKINGRPLTIPLANFEEPRMPADLILVAVKRYNLETILSPLNDFVGPNTLILSLMNSIDSEEILASCFGWPRVLYATCVGVDSNRRGRSVTLNSLGRLLLGEERNDPPGKKAEALRDFFESCGIPVEIPQDMRLALWRKLLVNVGMNQVSAIRNLEYGPFRNNAAAMEEMRAAQREVIQVAVAEGVGLSEKDIESWERQLCALSESGMSSMLQDIRQRRRTEVDSFGGTIIALGKKHGIPVPVNIILVNEIRKIEKLSTNKINC